MPNIATLSSVKGKEGGGGGGASVSDSEGEDGRERQGFYVGGSERSGQQVLGPGDDAVGRLFNAARRAGAEQMTPEEFEAAAGGSSSSGRSAQVQGGVYKLGGHGVPTEAVQSEQAAEQRADPNAPIHVRMNVWENGFSVDDGPLRAFDDPQSRPFLEAVTRGRIPPELVQKYPGRRVDIHMERKTSPYVAPKAKPFSGEAYRLGSIVPTVVDNSQPIPTKEPSVDEAAQLLKQAQEEVKLRDGEPTTRIQIRLPSGQRLVGNFNHEHNVEDVRTFIVTAIPSLAFQPFQLMTTFPNKVIENERETLKNADLLNAAIVVKHI
jgi:UBX domain-containing protein 1